MNLPEGWPTEYEKFSTWWENQKSYMAASKFEYWECWQASALAAPTPPAQENENRLCPECGAECMHVSIPNNSWHKCKKCSWESLPEPEDVPQTANFDNMILADQNQTLQNDLDRLRKAAQSLVALSDRWGTQMPYGIKVGIEDLRAALEK